MCVTQRRCEEGLVYGWGVRMGLVCLWGYQRKSGRETDRETDGQTDTEGVCENAYMSIAKTGYGVCETCMYADRRDNIPTTQNILSISLMSEIGYLINANQTCKNNPSLHTIVHREWSCTRPTYFACCPASILVCLEGEKQG